MNRLVAGLAAWSIAAAAVTTARAQTPAELNQTSSYVAAFQNPDGGFAPKAGGASTLPATSSAVRILKNTGGSIRFVRSAESLLLSPH